MAIKLMSVNGVNNENIAEFIVDTEDEKSQIPAEYMIQGTEAQVIEGGKRYRLDCNLQWVEIKPYSGSGGGGGPTVEVESVSVTQNGTVNAPYGKAYTPIYVNVENTYVVADEGKVVSNGALVAQAAHSTITQNGTYDTTLNDSVEIDVPPFEDKVPEKDVNFIDYDGTVLYAYTAIEFAQLNSLPENPVHEGLTSQGWNWTLADAKIQVANSKMLYIGQSYTTSDGETKIKIELKDNRLSPYLHLQVAEGVNVTINWGDGSSDIITGLGFGSLSVSIFTLHNYAAPGSYVISLSSQENGSIMFPAWGNGALLVEVPEFQTSSSSYQCYLSAIKEINLSPIVKIRGQMCDGMLGLEKVSLPNNATIDSETWGHFIICRRLKGIVLPNNMLEISTSMFQNCYNLKRISVPKSVTLYKTSAFEDCYSLEKFVMSDNVTVVENKCFSGCNALRDIYISSNIEVFPVSFLFACYVLSKVIINDNITTLNKTCLSQMGAGEIHFKSNNPPVAVDSTVFRGLSVSSIIYVPSGRRTTYMSTTNYPDPSTYTYVEEV